MFTVEELQNLRDRARLEAQSYKETSGSLRFQFSHLASICNNIIEILTEMEQNVKKS